MREAHTRHVKARKRARTTSIISISWFSASQSFRSAIKVQRHSPTSYAKIASTASPRLFSSCSPFVLYIHYDYYCITLAHIAYIYVNSRIPDALYNREGEQHESTHALLRIAHDVVERNSAAFGILEDFVFLSRPSFFAHPAATEIVRSFFRRMRKTQLVPRC